MAQGPDQFCGICGRQRVAGMSVCPNCGSPYERPESSSLSGSQNSIQLPTGEGAPKPTNVLWSVAPPQVQYSGAFPPVQQTPVTPMPGSMPPKVKSSPWAKIAIAQSVVIILLLVVVTVLLVRQPQLAGNTGGTGAASGATATPVVLATSTSAPTATATPASSPTSLPVPTQTALATPGTIPENIRLSCDCTDRVLVTITQIVIQPDQNRMLWSLTFYNNSQNGAGAAFANDNFYLQKGDQIHDPAPGEQKYNATGQVIGTFSGISLQAGETKQVTITFSFVPYTGIYYTLVTIMQEDCCGQEIVHFDPVLFTF